MEQAGKIKEFFKNMSSGLKKRLLVGGGALIAFAVIAAVVLNSGKETDYVPLYSGMNEQEAAEVMAKLQEAEADYRYRSDGSVMVPVKDADRTRATLALEGYPKSGFTYETYLNNSNMMSTEEDKKSLKTWDMQERLAATIRLVDGVKNAVVQITPGETQRYVLDNSEANVPTASVMVEMIDGGSPTPEQVEGIQRLVAKSVLNMDMGDVAVIDSNGIDVSVRRNDSQSPMSDAKQRFEQTAQVALESNILNILEPIYGRNNVRVSVKCVADMQRTISEDSSVTAPNAQANSGYISHEELTEENSSGGGAGGVPGADANANVPQYGTQPGAGDTYTGSTTARDYMLNQKKVQSQNDGGVITDVTVAVSINSKDLKITEDKLISSIGRAAGIDPAVQAQKIEVVNTTWATTTVNPGQNPNPSEDDTPVVNPDPFASLKKYLPFLIAGGVGLLLLLILLIILGSRSRKKKRAAMEAAMLERPVIPEGLEEAVAAVKEKIEVPQIVENEATRAIKDNIRGFAEENPEISAQLLKNWIRGGEN